jgi:tetratricopeptide (TPR) repeat protein
MRRKTLKKILIFSSFFIFGFLIGVLTTYLFIRTIIQAQADVSCWQAMEYLEKNSYDHAIALLNQAIALNPKDYTFYLTLAEVYETKGNYEMALYEYECALSLCLKDSKDSGICKYIEKKLNRLRMQIKSESKD